MEKYEYQPLTDPVGQIRLLQIKPGDKSEPIAITLRTYAREEAPPYAAVSYTWGDTALVKGISVNDALLHVTQSCWYSLGQLRLSQLHQNFWIDAICIHQQDLKEKGPQVSSMGQTFSRAEICLVSLGRHTVKSTMLSKMVAQVDVRPADDGEIIERLVKSWMKKLDHEMVVQVREGLFDCARHPYWRRLWIVQEFCLPQRVCILRGSHCVRLELFESLLNAFCDVSIDVGVLADVNKTLVVRKAAQKTGRGVVSTLPDVLVRMGHRECSDRRDCVYGLLSLVDWRITEPDSPLQADYTLTALELAVKVLSYCRNRQYGPLSPAVARHLIKILKIGPAEPSMILAAQRRALNGQGQVRVSQPTKTVKVKHLDHDIYACETDEESGTKHELSLTVSSLMQLDTDTLVLDAEKLLVEPYDTRPSSTTTRMRKPVLVLEQSDGAIYDIAGHGFIESASNRFVFSGSSKVIARTHIDEADFLFWIWNIIAADRTESGVLDFRVNGKPRSSSVILQQLSPWDSSRRAEDTNS